MRPSFRFGTPQTGGSGPVDRIVCVRWACLFVCLLFSGGDALLDAFMREFADGSRVSTKQPTTRSRRAAGGRALVLPGACQTTRQPASWSAATHGAERRRANMERKGPGGTLQACLVLRVARTHWNQLDSDYFEARVQAVAQRVRQGRRWPLWPNGRECGLSGIGLVGMRP